MTQSNTTHKEAVNVTRDEEDKTSNLTLFLPNHDGFEYTNFDDANPFVTIANHLARQIFVFTRCVKIPTLVGRFFFLGAVNRRPCVYLIKAPQEQSKTYYSTWELGKDLSFLRVPQATLPNILSNIYGI